METIDIPVQTYDAIDRFKRVALESYAIMIVWGILSFIPGFPVPLVPFSIIAHGFGPNPWAPFFVSAVIPAYGALRMPNRSGWRSSFAHYLAVGVAYGFAVTAFYGLVLGGFIALLICLDTEEPAYGIVEDCLLFIHFAGIFTLLHIIFYSVFVFPFLSLVCGMTFDLLGWRSRSFRFLRLRRG